MWNLSRPGNKPVSLALQRGFPTSGPPGKSHIVLKKKISLLMTGKMGREYASDWYKEEKSNNLFYLSILKAWVRMIEHQTINIKEYGNMRKQSQPCWKQWGIQTGCDHMGQAGISRNGQVHSDRLSSSARLRWPVWEGEVGQKQPCSNMVSHNLHSCLCPGLSPSSQTILTHWAIRQRPWSYVMSA